MLRHIPGQIVVLGTSSLQSKFDESYLSAFAELQISHSFFLNSETNSETYFLELFVVNSGEELRFLEYARLQAGVIDASLNYIGFGLSDERYIDDVEIQTEFNYQPGQVPPKNFQFILFSKDEEFVYKKSDFYYNKKELVEKIKSIDPNYLVAAIDVESEHCLNVVNIIREGFVGNNNLSDNEVIIGLSAETETKYREITDLYSYTHCLLLLADLQCEVNNETSNPIRVLSINMSVDFSNHLAANNGIYLDSISNESWDKVFTMPFFEKTLAIIVSSLITVEENSDPEEKKIWSPAIFAAAGNRVCKNDPLRIRLGYPATRPETIAVTFVKLDTNNKKYPSDDVDVPATTGLKPCFAINTDNKNISISRNDGSSFASAWLAGSYARAVLNTQCEMQYLGLLSKTAWLMQQTEHCSLPSGLNRLPCYVEVIPPEIKKPTRTPSDMDALISELNKRFKADFCLHGSSAAISEWLRLNNSHYSDIATWVHKDLGDVDLIYAGQIEGASSEGVKAFVRTWFKQKPGFNRIWVTDRKRPIELHPYEGLVTAAERLRSITPVNKLYITKGGVIDTWGGLSDLANGNIRFLPLTHRAFWERNAFFSSGTDCLGLNILQWISIITLLQLVSNAAGIYNHPVADNESLDQVKEILDKVENKTLGFSLFGYREYTTDMRERYDRRLERVETLISSCARHNIIDKELDNILKILCSLRDQSLPVQ